MPKIVDHEQRRNELAAAVWRVVADQGTAAVSIRTVAAEAGWSTGALRHYFATRGELLSFALQRTADRVIERITARTQTADPAQPPVEQVAGIVEELMPLDEPRRVEFRIWQAGSETFPVDTTQAAELWQAQRGLYRQLLTALAGRPGLADPERPAEDPWLETWAEYLHVHVDGLSTQLMFSPNQPPDHARALLRRFLTDIPGLEHLRE